MPAQFWEGFPPQKLGQIQGTLALAKNRWHCFFSAITGFCAILIAQNGHKRVIYGLLH